MIVDFSILEISQSYAGSVTFLDETAGFRNAFGMYKIGDDGGIYDVTVIFENGSADDSGGALVRGETTFDVSFLADDKIGFFVAPNAFSYDGNNLLENGATNYVMRNDAGDIANIADGGPIHLVHLAADGAETEVQALYDNITWHSAAEAANNFALNNDGTDHTIWDLQIENGRLVLDMRFEDLWAGGDMDYEDIVFRLDVGAENTLDAVDSGKDPAAALAASDRVTLPQGATVTATPLANDSGTGLVLTHLNGQAVSEGDSITLADGEIVTLLADGQIQITGANAPSDFDKVISYSVVDENGATDSSIIAIVTPAFANDDALLVTARGTAWVNVLSNDILADGGALSLTHFAGEAVSVGASFTLGSGTVATYQGNGSFSFVGADITSDLLDRVSYTILDQTGLSDVAMLQVLTSPVDGTANNDNFSASGHSDAQGNMIGGSDGNAEVVLGYGGNDKLFTGEGDDALYGGEGHDNLRGHGGDDLLYGGSGHDLLAGGIGVDTVYGGAGNDAYWVEAAHDVIIEAADEGTDKVRSMVDWTLGDHFENLYLDEVSLGGVGVTGTGNALSNFIGGNALDNVLYGMAGRDRITGQAGNDTIDGGAGDDDVDGNEGDDHLIGGKGRDKLRGGEGADTIEGGAHNDVYWANSADDILVEKAGEGFDLVKAGLDWTLGDNFEALRLLVGEDARIATGNALNNMLAGNEQDNTVTGLGGDDKLFGRGGNDTLLGGAQNDKLNGGTGADYLEGGSGNDKLRGQAGSDRLDGGTGDDVLIGGDGADTFVFAAGDGEDLLYDFTRGEDKIEIAGETFETLSFTERNLGCEIDYGTEDTIWVAKLGGEMLSETDFLFV